MTNQTAANQKLLLNSHDAAEALSISERKLWELTNRGDLSCIRIGRAVRYDPRDMKAWIDKQKEVCNDTP